MFGKAKEKLDFTKHLGFQSGPDTLANRQALANLKEREAREAQVPQNSEQTELGPSDRDGIGAIAETLAGVATPKTENTLNQPSTPAPAADSESRNKDIKFDASPPHAKSEAVGESADTKEKVEGEHKDKGGMGWGRWVAHKVHQVQRAAASKDLSDQFHEDAKATK